MRKKCTICGKTRLIKFFSPRKNRTPTSTHSWCHSCRIKNGRNRYANLTDKQKFAWHISGKKSHLMRNYGLTLDEYVQKVSDQNNLCAICKVVKHYETHTLKGFKKNALGKRGKDSCHLDKCNLYVDHSHETNEVRGLLCKECNLAYGYIKEDTESIKNLLAYDLQYKRV
jgi:uncharacterized protein YbaR (Trm112 family)